MRERHVGWPSYDREVCNTVTPRDLAKELGHDDAGRAIRGFLRNPDDGRGPFARRILWTCWHLTPEQAERVRERFT